MFITDENTKKIIQIFQQSVLYIQVIEDVIKNICINW